MAAEVRIVLVDDGGTGGSPAPSSGQPAPALPPSPTPPPLPPSPKNSGNSPFDAIAEAQKRIEKERQKAQAQAAYENLTQGPADVTMTADEQAKDEERHKTQGGRGNRGNRPSQGAGEQAGKSPDYAGVLQNYALGSFKASLPPLLRMLGEEGGFFGGIKKRAEGGPGGGAGGTTGGGGDAAGYRGSGAPSPVFVENWPGSLHVTVDNWPSQGSQGGQQSAPNQQQGSQGGQQSAPKQQQAPQQIQYTPSTKSPPVQTPKTSGGGASAAGEAAGGAEAAEGAGAAAAEGGGMMAGLGAAGPIGLGIAVAVMAVDAGAKLLAGAINMAADGIRGLGDSAAMLARNDNLGAVTNAANMAGTALGKIPVVGQVFEAGVKLATTAISTFTQVTDAFIERGKQLQGYSPDLSAANANADIRSMMADIREAQQLGPDLARLTDAQSNFSTEFREMLLPIKEVLIKTLASVLEALEPFIPYAQGALAEVIEGIKRMAEILGQGFALHLPTMFKLIGQLPDKLGAAYKKAFNEAEERKKSNPADSLIQKQFDMLDRAARGINNVRQIVPGGAGGLNIPAFAG